MKIEREKVIFNGGARFNILPDKLVGLFPLGDTTPTVENNETWKAINTSSVTITNFLGGAVAQRIHILGDGNTAVDYGPNIKTNTGAAKLLESNKVYSFTNIDEIWYEDVDDLGSGGGGSGTDTDRAEIVFGVNGAEVSNAISVPAQAKHLDGTNYTTSLIDIEVIVSDASNDREPSATATLSLGTHGSMFAGSGTATGIFRTDVNGQLDIVVSETAAAFRYLWVVAGGNTRLFVKAKDAVHEVHFI